MSDHTGTRSTTPQAGARGTSGWVGWIAFAGMMLFLLGMFHVIAGLVALTREEYFLVRPSGLILDIDYSVWGWVHLLAGAVVMSAGIGVFSGRVWARAVGCVVALVSAVVNLGFLAAYPIWSVLMIALCVVVIMALTTHGTEIKAG